MTAAAYDQRAMEHVAAGRLHEAVDCLREGVGQHPGNLQLREGLLMCLDHAREYARVFQAYEDYRARGGRAVCARIVLARALLFTGRPRQALAVFSDAVANGEWEFEDGMEAINTLCSMASENDLKRESCRLGLALTRTMLQQAPEHVMVGFYRGCFLCRAGRGQEALPYLRRGVCAHPERHAMRMVLASTLYDLGRKQAAASEYRRVSPQAISDEETLGRVAAILAAAGEDLPAADWLERLRQVRREQCRDIGSKVARGLGW